MNVDKGPIAILFKYVDFIDVFSLDLIVELSDHTRINDYSTELIDSKQLFYEPIYTLKPVDLDILKTYIKTNLANGFIRSFKFPKGALIFFIQKFDSSFY